MIGFDGGWNTVGWMGRNGMKCTRWFRVGLLLRQRVGSCSPPHGSSRHAARPPQSVGYLPTQPLLDWIVQRGQPRIPDCASVGVACHRGGQARAALPVMQRSMPRCAHRAPGAQHATCNIQTPETRRGALRCECLRFRAGLQRPPVGTHPLWWWNGVPRVPLAHSVP